MKTYQDWCIDFLYSMLKKQHSYCGSVKDQGYIYTIKSIITHYASMYYVGPDKKIMRNKGKEHLNLWWDHLSAKSEAVFYEPLLKSENAQIALEDSRGDIDKQKAKLHLEHISPGAYIYERLCRKQSVIEKELIRRELKYNRLVLLTKEEVRRYLDGKDQCFEKRDIDRFSQLFHEVALAYEDDLKGLIGKSAKSCGCGLLRMTRLSNKRIEFYKGNKKVAPKDWLSYFDEPMEIRL